MEGGMMPKHLILKPMDVDEQKDLRTLLSQWKKTTAFYSHEPLNSAVIQQIEMINT